MNPPRSPRRPFLKWAGGKRWLAERHPDLFDVSYKRFVEPFLGGGSIFFHLAPPNALLSDSNTALIAMYTTIRDDWKNVVRHLRRHHSCHSRSYYYQVRSSKPKSAASQAARIIYLNRTCWNGLYRVNRCGIFNVPIGSKTNVVLETDDFRAVSAILSNVAINACDFEQTLSECGRGDFVFVDPPYTVQHNHNGFIKYNEGLFSWEDQVRLRTSAVAAMNRGAKLLITNASHDSVRELYKNIGTLLVAQRSSVISGQSCARGLCEELVIKCF